MTQIVFLDRDTLPSSVIVRRPNFAHQWREYRSDDSISAIECCRNGQIIITNKVPITDELLSANPSIKHIAVAATGFNIVDLAACNKHGVSVSNIRSYANVSVPEHVISMALNLRRELISYRQNVIDGQWQKSPYFCLFDKPINDLAHSVFGVIGFGELGQATAKLAHALGMKVIFSSRSQHFSDFAKQVDFSTLIAQSDIISCHCSLSEQTQNLLSTSEFVQMKDSAIVINTARGGIIDELALKDAIKQQQIGGTGVDVLCEEPPTNQSPLLSIAHYNNVIITPHTAWASQQAIQGLADQLIDNIDAYNQGILNNIVSV